MADRIQSVRPARWFSPIGTPELPVISYQAGGLRAAQDVPPLFSIPRFFCETVSGEFPSNRQQHISPMKMNDPKRETRRMKLETIKCFGIWVAVFIVASAHLAAQGVGTPSHGANPPNPPPVALSVQLEAMAKYPELGRAGSPFNREFLARMWRHAAGDRTIFQNERWPVMLADEVAAAGLPSVKTALASKTPPPPRGIGRASSRIPLSTRTASAPMDAPPVVQDAVAAGNMLQTRPYKWGGGHGSLEDWGYDCSGSVSYVLMKAGLLGRPLTSGSFATYGDPGPGRWITIFAGPGHVFMSVCGLRLDTGGRRGIGESGPRWSPYPRYASGFVARHPPGF